MPYTWSPTNAPEQTRYDDIWFIDQRIGWAVNSAGQILHTKDGGESWSVQQTADADTWLRCMSFSSPTDGWVGSITRKQRMWRTQDGKSWVDVTASLPPVPSAVCGICSPSKNVVYAAGTQYPAREAGITHTSDGGQTWASISMAAHANLLIDTFFTDDKHGWVVGGQGGTTYDRLKPVVLYTADGGQSWEDRLQNSGINFPRGEWGWKIQFISPQIGFVSLQNFTSAAILKTVDGGQTWKRIEIVDQQKNVNLEGIGFIDESVGWVGGWGAGFPRNPLGTSSGTTDGGATWSDANDIGRFINRLRFTKTTPVVAYASGRTVYRCVAAPAIASLSARKTMTSSLELPRFWNRLEVRADVPEKAKRLRVAIFDSRQTLVKIIADEASPGAGQRSFDWDFVTEEGRDAGIGQFMYRIWIDGSVTTGTVARPGHTPPDELGNQVAAMIKRYAAMAKRSHDELVLPDREGKPVSLKSLFDTPQELMAGLIRGGWIVPGAPDRSMLLVALIQSGPMQSELAPDDVELLSEWISAGAVVPAAS